MAKSRRTANFSAHDISFFDADTQDPLGCIQSFSDLTLTANAELITNQGGVFNNNIQAEPGNMDAEITFTLKEYPPNFLFRATGYEVIETAAEALGGTSNFVNTNGTTTFDATVGIVTATVKAGSEADLKTGTYFVKVVSATTVDVFMDTGVRHKNGTTIDFVDDSLKITATPLTITLAVPVDIPDTGLELTGGTGAIAMVVGDIARFEAREINSGSSEISLPGATCPTAVSVHIYGETCSDSKVRMLEVPRAIIMPWDQPFTRKEFSEIEITMKAITDQASDVNWTQREIAI